MKEHRLNAVADVRKILRDLQAPDLSEKAEASLKNRLHSLAKHPWCWPAAVLDERLLKDEASPSLHNGDVLLVGVRDDGTRSMMRLRSDARIKASGQVLEDTKDAWAARRRAAERATPFILNPQLEDTPINIEALFERTPLILDGDSYGLAFAISQASLLVATPVSPHVVALATIDGDGNTGDVGKLSEKIGEVLTQALNIQSFLVTPRQVEEARKAVTCYAPDDDTLQVVGVGTVGEAIEYIWPEIESEFECRLGKAGVIDELLDELYTKTLEGWGPFQIWHPVINTLNYLLGTNRLREDDTIKARFALSIALRHAGQGDEQFAVRPSIDEIMRSEKRGDYHAAILGQYVQSFSDAGAELSEDVQRKLQSLYEDLQAQRSAYSESLKTLGAYARLLNRDGSPAEAFELLDMILNEWWAYRRKHAHEASHPLCAILHSVELMRDANAYSKVKAQMERFEAWGVKNSYWINFAHARALSSLGEVESAAQMFEKLRVNDNAPTFMRYSSVRWRWRCEPHARESASAHLQAIRDKMKAVDDSAENANDLNTFSHLSLLDYGLYTDDDQAIAQAQNALGQVTESGLFRRLLETTPANYSNDAQWLADAYPY